LRSMPQRCQDPAGVSVLVPTTLLACIIPGCCRHNAGPGCCDGPASQQEPEGVPRGHHISPQCADECRIRTPLGLKAAMFLVCPVLHEGG
jgi:hypothetical protein